MVSVDRDVEKLEPSYIAGENVKGVVTLEKQFGSSLNVEYRITIQSSNSTPKYMSKRNENMSTQKKTCTQNVHAALCITAKTWKLCPSTHN